MEKLEECESRKRISVKTAIVTIAVLVSTFSHLLAYDCINQLYSIDIYFPFGHILGWLRVV